LKLIHPSSNATLLCSPNEQENYEALVDIFRRMGVLDPRRTDLRRPGTTEPFAAALRRCMSPPPEGGQEEHYEDANAKRKKLVQASDGASRRRAFGQLYEELAELAFKYYFVIPSYYILVMRAFVTLEGIALNADDEFNMYDVTAEFARKTLLTPQTEGGRVLLRQALFTRDGRRALRGARTKTEAARAVALALGGRAAKALRSAIRAVPLPWRRRNRKRNRSLARQEWSIQTEFDFY
jgi:hypothetical protein